VPLQLRVEALGGEERAPAAILGGAGARISVVPGGVEDNVVQAAR
jgi:hypothetical protein